VTTPARRTTARTKSSRTSRSGVVRVADLRSSAARPHLWVVPDGDGVRRSRTALRRRRAPVVALLLVLLLGTVLGLLFLNTAIAVDSLKATQLRDGNAQRVQDVQQLEQQVVNGSTPERVAAAAAAAGMVPAGPPAYLVIGPDGSSTVRGTPEPAPQPAPPAPPSSGPVVPDRAGD
jgi:hypothetical protein